MKGAEAGRKTGGRKTVAWKKKKKAAAKKKAPTVKELVRLAGPEQEIVDGKVRWEGYWVRWTDPKTGEYVRKRFKDEKKAVIFKAKQEVKLRNVLSDTNVHETRLTGDQLRQAEAAIHKLGEGYSLDQAVTFFLKHHAGPDLGITLQSAVNAFIDAGERKPLRPRTIAGQRSVLDNFRNETGDDTPISTITPIMVENWLEGLRGKDKVTKASARTFINYRAVLSAFFNFCARRSGKAHLPEEQRKPWIDGNSAAIVEKRKINEQGIPDVLSSKEAAKLMKHAAEYEGGTMARYFALALFAGLRPGGELLAVGRDPRAIDLDTGVIRVSPDASKTRRGRTIKIKPNLRRWLQRFGGPMWPEKAEGKNRVAKGQGPYRIIREIRAKFGLSHDVLRHTFCSMHVARWGSCASAAQEAGNSESVIRKHYEDVRSKKEAIAFWKIHPPPVARATKREG